MLGHHPLVAGGQRRIQEVGRVRWIGRDQPVHAVPSRHQCVQGGQPLGGRRFEQVGTIPMQDVEEEHRKWLRRAGSRNIDRSAEP